MTNLFEDTRRHVEGVVRDLTGDEDFLPLMAVRDHRDRLIVCGIMMPDDQEQKEQVASTMTAICCMHRAQEVAFASCAWMVRVKPGEPEPTVMPSQHPNREEIVFINTVDADERAEVYMANLVRENGMAGVGVWDQKPGGGGGLFVNAIRLGIAMGKKIPPDLAGYLDEVIDSDDKERMGRVLAMMTKTFGIAKAMGEQQMKGGVQN